MQHVTVMGFSIHFAAAVLTACAQSGRVDRDLPVPPRSESVDTSAAGAYAAVLQVVRDSVVNPTFPRAGPIPVVLWDSSVSHPLSPDRYLLQEDILEQLERRELVDAHCPSLAAGSCTSERPIWWIVLTRLTCHNEPLCESGFAEMTIEGKPGPRLDGSARRVLLRRTSHGWVVVEVSLLFES